MMKSFEIARNAIPHIHDIEIINAFHDGVRDIKTIEENTIKKPKTVADLLTVTDVCIEALEARAWLLDSRNMGRQIRSNGKIERSMMQIVGCRKRRDRFDDLAMSRSGAKSIA
jgi:hypothetical protein